MIRSNATDYLLQLTYTDTTKLLGISTVRSHRLSILLYLNHYSSHSFSSSLFLMEAQPGKAEDWLDCNNQPGKAEENQQISFLLLLLSPLNEKFAHKEK